MEELFAYAIMLKNEMVSETAYFNRLNKLFIENPTDEILLELEWENRIKYIIAIIIKNVDYLNFDINRFGKVLICLLEDIYSNCENIKWFSKKSYSIWTDITYHIQELDPFFILSYIDEPLSWGDEEQTKKMYEYLFNYYK